MGHTIFPRWYDSMEFQIGLIEMTVITRISASSKFLQVPFSFSKYRSLAYILLRKYPLFKFALSFSLPRTHKRLVQPYRGSLRLSRYSETFLRTFITHMHIQSLPRSLDAATIAENWSLTERRFRYLERTVLGRHLLSCYTVLEWGVEGRGMRGLSQILSDVSLSYSLRHISTGEHSLHISWRSTHLLHLYFLFSWWRHQMETCSASLAFVRGIHRWLRGIHRSPVNSPHTDQWRGALMFSSICAWTNGWVNNRDAGYLRRHRPHYDVTVIWCRIVIQWSGQPWVLSAFNASLLSNFELVKVI